MGNNKSLWRVGFLSLILCIFFLRCSSTSEHYDILIKNTQIVDGTGKPAFKGSIAIQGEKIAAVGKIKGDADTVIDGSGLVTCPGFIDPHNHGDFSVTQFPLVENFVQQGLTTMVAGNCGKSPAPAQGLSFAQWLTKVEELGISINMAMLVGLDNLRILALGKDFKRKATGEEIEKMKTLLDESMKSGAFGLSGGIDPPWPGYFASMEEKVELAKVVGKYGGFYDPHTRHERNQWFTNDVDKFSYVLYYGPPEDIWVGRYRGLLEAIEVCKRANIPLHIAHIPNAYLLPLPHPDYLEEAAARATMEIVDRANEQGVRVTCDVILPPRAQTVKLMIDEFFTEDFVYPDWLAKNTKEELIEKLKTEEFRAKIRELYDTCQVKFSMIHTKVDPYWMDCFKVVKCTNKDYEGKFIGEIAQRRNAHPLDVVFDIIVEDPQAKWCAYLDRRYNQAAVSTMLQHPLCEPCTDDFPLPAKLEGIGAETLASLSTSPTAFGMYPYYIKTYVKEKAILSLEEAVKKATSLPAKRLGLDRGVLSPGLYADIVVFNFDNINMKIDFLHPDQKPEGIEYVIVNGKVVYKDGAHTNLRPGKVLRKKI